MRSGVYEGLVMHHRLGAPEHRFTHAVSFFAIHLDEVDHIARSVWPVGVERPGLLGLRSRDHMGDPRATLSHNYRALLREHGMDDDGEGVLVTHLRQLGYVFNPISLVYWYHRGALTGVIAEVSNTFGERHPYVFPVDGATTGTHTFVADKAMHVSPFLGMDHRYVFRLGEPGPRFAAAISLERDGRRAFHPPIALGKELPHRSPETLSGIDCGLLRGCAATTSPISMPSSPVTIGSCVCVFGSYIQMP